MLESSFNKTKSKIALRIWGGPLELNEIKMPEGNYRLLSIPFYLLKQIDRAIEEVI